MYRAVYAKRGEVVFAEKMMDGEGMGFSAWTVGKVSMIAHSHRIGHGKGKGLLRNPMVSIT